MFGPLLIEGCSSGDVVRRRDKTASRQSGRHRELRTSASIDDPDVVSISGYLDGEEPYPALQFDRDGNTTPGLGALADQLRAHPIEAEIVSYCTCPRNERSEEKSPIDWLRSGQPIERALRAALSG